MMYAGSTASLPAQRRQSAHPEQQEENVFCFELRHAPAVFLKKPRSDERQRRKDDDARADKDQRPHRKRRKDEAQRDHGSEVVHKAGGENAFAKIGAIEAEFQHDGIDNSHRSGGQGNSGEPTGGNGPLQQ